MNSCSIVLSTLWSFKIVGALIGNNDGKIEIVVASTLTSCIELALLKVCLLCTWGIELGQFSTFQLFYCWGRSCWMSTEPSWSSARVTLRISSQKSPSWQATCVSAPQHQPNSGQKCTRTCWLSMKYCKERITECPQLKGS